MLLRYPTMPFVRSSLPFSFDWTDDSLVGMLVPGGGGHDMG